MLTPGPAAAHDPPGPDALDGVVRQLEAGADHVGIVRLVDRWSQDSQPTRTARMAEARALIALCLMDRAWARLRELTVEDPEDAAAIRLTAEMFLQRGWPARARRLVDRLNELVPDAPWLEDLRVQADAAPASAPSNPALAGTDRLEAARQLLSAGKVIRARGLLEQLRRESPKDPQIHALLWAVRGDSNTRYVSLSQLIQELLAGLAAGGWEGNEHTELSTIDGLVGDDPETAEVSKVLSASRMGAGGFPSLFRAEEGIRTSFMAEQDDVTMAVVMASAEQLVEPPTADVTDPDVYDLSGVEAGDTQIMQVINRPDGSVGVVPVDGVVGKDEPADSRQPLDLRAWQQRQDGEALADTLDDDIDEDDDLVEMRSRAPAVASAPHPAPAAGPINVIERFPVPDPIPDLPGEDEDTPPVQGSPVPRSALASAPPPRMRRTPATDQPEADLPAPDRRLMPFVVAAAALAIAVTLLAAFGVSAILADQRQESVQNAVMDADPDGLRQARASLRAELQSSAGKGHPEMASWLVVTDVLLWAYWEGDLSLLEEARGLVDSGATGTGLSAERARAHLLWANGERDAVQKLTSSASDAAMRLLLADVQLSAHDGDAAKATLAGADELGVRGQVLLDQASGGSPRSGAAAAVHPLGVLARAGDSKIDDARRLSELAQLRKSVSPDDRRMIARAWAAEARLHGVAGRREAARDAWEKARQADPNDTFVLNGGAASVAADGRFDLARGRLERCLELRAAHADCQRGLVQVLLVGDELAAAVSLTDKWRDNGVDMGLLGPWVDLLARTRVGRARAVVEAIEAAGGEPDPRNTMGLAVYLLGLAQPDSARAADDLARASGLLKDSANDWDGVLAPLATRLAAERRGSNGR